MTLKMSLTEKYPFEAPQIPAPLRDISLTERDKITLLIGEHEPATAKLKT